MAIKIVAALCILAILSWAMVSVDAAECRWLDCHAHSVGDWCHTLGPGWTVKEWKHCAAVFGKQELCCRCSACL